MIIDTISSMVVTVPVSLVIRNIAANNTPKFHPKFTNQLIVRSSLLAISKPSGMPVGRLTRGFRSRFFLAFLGTFSSATPLGCSVLTTGFATAFALATGFALATAFAFGLASVLGLAPPALSNNPI